MDVRETGQNDIWMDIDKVMDGCLDGWMDIWTEMNGKRCIHNNCSKQMETLDRYGG